MESKLKKLKKNHTDLMKEFEEVSSYIHILAKIIKEINREIEKLESKQWFKYKKEKYLVKCCELKGYKSLLLKNNKGYLILINNNLRKKEKQKELHSILKRKKCMKKIS